MSEQTLPVIQVHPSLPLGSTRAITQVVFHQGMYYPYTSLTAYIPPDSYNTITITRCTMLPLVWNIPVSICSSTRSP